MHAWMHGQPTSEKDRLRHQAASLLIPSEARSLLGLESCFVWRIFCVRLNFLSYSLRRLRPRRHMLLSQKWAPSRWSCKAYKLYGSCKAYKLYGSAGLCLPGKSIFARPKMIAPPWPKLFVLSLTVKMLLDVACQLAYSWLHCFTIDDTVDLLWLLMLQHRPCTMHAHHSHVRICTCHMI